MMDQFKDAFREEAGELLNSLEQLLLELEERPDDQEIVQAVFRTMHTIKGSGAMFGFEHVSSFTHELETAMDDLRQGRIRVSKELISLTLESRDLIRILMEKDGDPPDEVAAACRSVTDRLKRLCAAQPAETQTADASAGTPSGTPSGADRQGEVSGVAPVIEFGSHPRHDMDHRQTYRIRFRPDSSIFLSGTNPVLLLQELQDLGEALITALTSGIPPLDAMDPERCAMSWDILLTTTADINSVRDIFIFVESNSELEVVVIDDESMDLRDPGYKRLGEILQEKGVVDDATINGLLSSQHKLGELLLENKLVSSESIDSALVEQKRVRELREAVRKDVTATVRVSSEKLDTLVDLVGELVTVQASLSQRAQSLSDPELVTIGELVERLVSELRENTMSMRMLPIGSTFSKFRRLVRDLSQEMGKDAELTTYGAETELDKTVIERLNDPLVHLIRNSVDHGIERPEERKRLGKPVSGSVILRAEHSGAYVLIHIEDDGKGLDGKAIKRKAIEKGMLAPDAEPSDEELFLFIFAPGFSTSEKITQISGRGVGMDVVKKGIEALGGIVTVESESGVGTHIILKLPLTLAIIEGLLVHVADDAFIFPLSNVEECLELIRQEGDEKRREIVNNRGEILPFVRLRRILEYTGESPAIEQIVVVNVRGDRIGYVVDDVVGDHQTVIKSLGRMYRRVQGVSGATIMGDGSIALILDVLKLSELAEGAQSHA